MSKCTRSQGFGLNLVNFYAQAGQTGHTGVDDSCGYGSKIYALKEAIVYKILDDQHPANDGSGYWGIFMIAKEPDGRLTEWQIGHCSKIYVKPGDIVKPWDIIGEEGNKGRVAQDGVEITKAMQDAGDRRGSHRHYNKKYLVKLTEEARDVHRGQILTVFSKNWPPEFYRDEEGYTYGVVDYYNGYNGGVDCAADIDNGRKLVEMHSEEQELDPVELEQLKISLMQRIVNLLMQIIRLTLLKPANKIARALTGRNIT